MPASSDIRPNRIYLIGFMGAGKSTLGKKMAERLGWDFVDSDALAEMRKGMTVAELFRQEGEEAFRQLERDLLDEVAIRRRVIISVGGGAPCFFDNMDRMLQSGLVIWLNATPQVILSRIGEARDRPLLAKATDKLAEIERLLSKRTPYYDRAHKRVDTDEDAEERLWREVSACR